MKLWTFYQHPSWTTMAIDQRLSHATTAIRNTLHVHHKAYTRTLWTLTFNTSLQGNIVIGSWFAPFFATGHWTMRPDPNRRLLPRIK